MCVYDFLQIVSARSFTKKLGGKSESVNFGTITVKTNTHTHTPIFFIVHFLLHILCRLWLKRYLVAIISCLSCSSQPKAWTRRSVYTYSHYLLSKPTTVS